MTIATISINDFVMISGQVVGVLKSRKGQHVNAPSAREGQTTVFYELDMANKSYGTAHEIDLSALVIDRDAMSSKINPAVIAEISKIILQ